MIVRETRQTRMPSRTHLPIRCTIDRAKRGLCQRRPPLIRKRPVVRAAVFLVLAALARPSAATAATYLPLSDSDLTRQAKVIVLAEAVDSEYGLGSDRLPYTSIRLRPIEVLKGSLPGETFRLRLPGGQWNDMGYWVPGTPTLLANQKAVLFLEPRAEAGEYGLTEFGLSQFDVMEDTDRNLYAVRSVFTVKEDRYLSRLASAAVAKGAIRELQPFLDSLRSSGGAVPLAAARYRVPSGVLRIPRRGYVPTWVNIGGREPGMCGTRTPCLIRWFWDTGASPNANVRITGEQTNLFEGGNGHPSVAAAIAAWTGVSGTTVRYAGPGSDGNVEVRLDVASASGGSWSAPIGCGAGGVLGVGGPSFQLSLQPFNGDSYFPAVSAAVEMRKSSCTGGFSTFLFGSVVLHELGHTLALGHSNTGQSTHSTTTAADWDVAVMRSSVAADVPQVPQPDDIQAIQYYYPTIVAGAPCVPDATTLCMNNGRFSASGTFRTAAGQTGAFMAVPVASAPDSGLFWFFAPSNLEMLIKVLNGCGLNSRYWVFFSAGTNVEFTVTVTDTQTGAVRTYSNPLNTAAAPVQDTSAFATCP